MKPEYTRHRRVKGSGFTALYVHPFFGLMCKHPILGLCTSFAVAHILLLYVTT